MAMNFLRRAYAPSDSNVPEGYVQRGCKRAKDMEGGGRREGGKEGKWEDGRYDIEGFAYPDSRTVIIAFIA